MPEVNLFLIRAIPLHLYVTFSGLHYCFLFPSAESVKKKKKPILQRDHLFAQSRCLKQLVTESVVVCPLSHILSIPFFFGFAWLFSRFFPGIVLLIIFTEW